MTFDITSVNFTEQVLAFKADWSKTYSNISNEKTPQVDGNGKPIIRKRPDGYNYLEDSYMRAKLDQHFPGWSWEGVPLYFLGSEWVVGQGHLVILDEHLLQYGMNPPVRKFFGCDSVRIQYRKDLPHLPENIVDVGDNCKQANTAALKYAINRLCRIGDDIYGKRTELDGAGDLDTILETAGTLNAFMEWLSSKKILISKACELVGANSLDEITDYVKAMEIIKEKRGWK